MRSSGSATLSGITLSSGSLNILGGETLTITGGTTTNGHNYRRFQPRQLCHVLGLQWHADAFRGRQRGPEQFDAQLNTSNGGTLTQAAGHAISGEGTINAVLINQGLVEANLGTLSLTSTITNAGGTILASGGNVQIVSGAMIGGGTLASTGTSNLSLSSGSATLSGITLSGGSLNILAGATLTISGGTTTEQRHDYGGFEQRKLANVLDLQWQPDALGERQRDLGHPRRPTQYEQQRPAHPGRRAHDQRLGTINAALVNQGLVNANVNGQTLSLATNPMSNAGTMEATGGGALNIENTVTTPAARSWPPGGNVQIERRSRSTAER